MADITEIIEESAVQLEIVESGGGIVEIVDINPTIIEIVENSFDSTDLNISQQTNIITIESSTENTNVDITTDSTLVETIITKNIVEISEPAIFGGEIKRDVRISGSLTVTGSVIVSSSTFTNIGPFINKGNVNASGTIVGSNLSGINTGDQDLSSYSTIPQLNASSSVLQTNIDTKAPITNPSFTGNISASGNLVVSDTIFSDVISTSIAHFTGDGINNILIIKSGSNSPVTINPEGLIIFDEFNYTPTVVQGGLLYSGSDFYFGLE